MKTLGGYGVRRRGISASRHAGLREPFPDFGVVLGAALDAPFYEGQNAFDRGEGRKACPQDAPSAVRQRWLDGWREAKRYADVQAIIEAARSAAPLSPGLFARIAGDEPRTAGP